MIYTPLTENAMKIAFDAHKDQKDKSGLPYFHHPMHLAEQFNDEKLVATAMLHDIVEDTSITFEDLKKANIPDDVLSALKLLTHENHQNYDEYIKKIANNEIARKVKMADLQHNMDETRLRPDNCTNAYDAEKIKKRRDKYKAAYTFLKQYNDDINEKFDCIKNPSFNDTEINNEPCVITKNEKQNNVKLDSP